MLISSSSLCSISSPTKNWHFWQCQLQRRLSCLFRRAVTKHILQAKWPLSLYSSPIVRRKLHLSSAKYISCYNCRSHNITLVKVALQRLATRHNDDATSDTLNRMQILNGFSWTFIKNSQYFFRIFAGYYSSMLSASLKQSVVKYIRDAAEKIKSDERGEGV